jgi:hypothetical protein
MPTEIARRVARRHQAAVVFQDVPATETGIEYMDSGRISAVALMNMLEPSVGKLVRLRFRRSFKIDPNGVSWEALDEHANVLTGRLVLHAAFGESELVSWAEVVVDESRDARAARRVALRYMRRTEGLVPVDGEDNDEQRTVLVDPKHLRLIEPA